MGCKNAKPPLEIPGDYIIHKNIDGIKKEQFAHVTNQAVSQGTYNYEYGLCSNHEGNCHRENIRTLTKEEKKLKMEGKTFALPQQFYQSGPY